MALESATPTATEPRVLRLTDAVSDVRYEDVRSTLERALALMKPGAKFEQDGFGPTHCAIVIVDERGEGYTVRLLCSQGNTSKIISLLEIAKQLEIRSMFS